MSTRLRIAALSRLLICILALMFAFQASIASTVALYILNGPNTTLAYFVAGGSVLMSLLSLTLIGIVWLSGGLPDADEAWLLLTGREVTP